MVAPNGHFVAHIRIEEVSKNHTGKNFVVRVKPDLAHNPLLADIAYDMTIPIFVRSKVKKSGKAAVPPVVTTDLRRRSHTPPLQVCTSCFANHSQIHFPVVPVHLITLSANRTL